MSEWKEYKLGEITTEIGDGIHGTPNYSEDGEFYFINGNNISNGKIMIKGDTKRVNRIEFEKTRDNVPQGVDLGKLPADASEMLRIVRVGVYDTCACIGAHVENTSEIGTFRIISHSFENGTLRLRFKLA